MAGAPNKGGECRVLLHAVLDARSHCVGGKGKDLANSVWVAYREVEAEDSPVAPPDDVGLWHLQRVHQCILNVINAE